MNQPGAIEVVDLEAMGLEDFDVACDYSISDQYNRAFPWPHGPARWIARAHCEECGLTGTRLICEACKANIIAAEFSGVSCPKCDHVMVPARKAYSSFEPLEKK